MSFFIAANILNYIDRGIIPGASQEFDHFIIDSHELKGTSYVDTFLGLLQSMFIIGFSISGTIFGNLVHTHPPFRLVGYGLLFWCLAAAAAGLSYYTGSYVILALARILSGVGEASFSVVAAPYIQDNAGASQGFWLGLFYTAVPFGTATGYAYGAMIAGSLGWSWAFFLEGLGMLPLALFALFLPGDIHKMKRNRLG